MIPTLNNPIQKIIIHNTAVSHKVNPDQWDQTNEYHRQQFNFKSSLGFCVGYTYEISADGKVRQARALGEETAAVLGENKRSISICLDGNFDIEMPTVAQQKALRTLLLQLLSQTKISPNKIYPHRAFCGIPPRKTCFGSLLPDNWGTFLVANPESMITDATPLGSIYTRNDFEAH